MDYFVSLFIFWGVWLLVPILIDGLTTIASLVGVGVSSLRRFKNPAPQLDFSPLVSLIIPVYNSAETLEACLRSIAAQDYPLDRMEILLVDNGSSDDSFKIFARLQEELRLQLSWHSIINQGKSWALNAGIHLVSGSYIFNIDSDVVLAKDAVRQAVTAMEFDPKLGAVTGAIQVLPPPSDASSLVRILGECEFFEYLTAFHVGREQQSLLHNLYTLSGAFSVFRREVLLQTFLYSRETVTEDTDLTFEIYERFRELRIACVSAAIAYVHPIESLSALYAQRIRWQRGQIEVSARHAQAMRKPIWTIRGFSPARVLLVDHTLSFPRAVWTFLLPILTLFGYSPSLILISLIVMYGFYTLIDLVWVGAAWLGANKTARRRLLKFIYLLPLMPLYRMVVYWFRLGGFLHAVAEPGIWSVQDPLDQMRQSVDRLIEWLDGTFRRFPLPKPLSQFKISQPKASGVPSPPVEEHPR